MRLMRDDVRDGDRYSKVVWMRSDNYQQNVHTALFQSIRNFVIH